MRVLWADDEPGNIWGALERLRERDATVEVARSAEEAIAYLHQRPHDFDVIVLDIWLKRREPYDDQGLSDEPAEWQPLVDPRTILPPNLRIKASVLPEHVGAELARIVRNELRIDTPIVVYSARAGDVSASTSEKLSSVTMCDLVPKTPDHETLIEMIEAAATAG